MRLPATKAFAASLAYLAGHAADVVKILWLPALLLTAALFYALPPYMTSLAAITALGPNPDPEAALALMGPAMKWIGVLILANAVAYPMAIAGVLRHVVRGEAPKLPFYFRYGADEFRIALSFILLIVCVTLISLVVSLGSLALGAALSAAAPAAGAAVLAATPALFIIPMIWFGVRMSLVFPATIATRRIGVPLSWQATKGTFWPLAGYFALWALVMAAIAIPYLLVQSPDYFADMRALADAARDPVRTQEINARMMEKQAAAWSPSSPGFAFRAAAAYVYTMATFVLWTVPAGVAWRYIAGERES